MGQVGAGLQWFTRGILLSPSAPVLAGNHGSGGRIVIEDKTVTCSEAAQSSGACGKGSDESCWEERNYN